MSKDLTREKKEVKEMAEEYIKALRKGDLKFFEKNIDFKEAYEFDREFYGQMSQTKDKSQKEYEEEGKSGLRWAIRKWDKKFEIRAIQVSKDRAMVVIDAEGAKTMDQGLVLSKKSGKWKIILMPTWQFEKM